MSVRLKLAVFRSFEGRSTSALGQGIRIAKRAIDFLRLGAEYSMEADGAVGALDALDALNTVGAADGTVMASNGE